MRRTIRRGFTMLLEKKVWANTDSKISELDPLFGSFMKKHATMRTEHVPIATLSQMVSITKRYERMCYDHHSRCTYEKHVKVAGFANLLKLFWMICTHHKQGTFKNLKHFYLIFLFCSNYGADASKTQASNHIMTSLLVTKS